MACSEHWPFSACSYGGVCNETLGKCVCSHQYISSGDLIIDDGQDCAVPRALLETILLTVLICSITNIILRIFEVTKTYRLKARFQGKAVNPFARTLVYHSWGLVVSLALLVNSVAYWILRNEAVGKNIAKTTLHCVIGFIVWRYLQYVSSFFLQNISIIMGVRSKTRSRYMERIRSYLLPLMWIGVCFVHGIIPWAIYFTKSQIWLSVFAAFMIYTMLLVAILLFTAAQGFIEVINDVLENGNSVEDDMRHKLEHIRKNAWLAKVVLYVVISTNVGFYIAVLAWPWARNFMVLQVVILHCSGVAGESIARELGKVVSARAARKFRLVRVSAMGGYFSTPTSSFFFHRQKKSAEGRSSTTISVAPINTSIQESTPHDTKH